MRKKSTPRLRGKIAWFTGAGRGGRSYRPVLADEGATTVLTSHEVRDSGSS